MIFPDWGETPVQRAEGEDLPLFTEWAVDWEKKSFDTRDGAFYTVTGTEALKIWIWRVLQLESARYQYTAWSWDYGNELAAALGFCVDQGILESRLRRYIREAVLVSPYILEADGFSFSRDGSRLEVRFTAHTVYEDFDYETEVAIG